MQVSLKTDAQAKQLTITLSDVDWGKIQRGGFYQGEQQVQRFHCENPTRTEYD